jgi:chromosome segregation ATPase
MDDVEEVKAPRWPLWLAALASLGWLGSVVAAAMAMAGSLAVPPPVLQLGVGALALLPALAVLWLVAMQLRGLSAARLAQAEAAEARIELASQRLDQGSESITGLETRLASLEGMLASMGETLASQHAMISSSSAALASAGSALDASGASANAATARLAEAIPQAEAQAEALIALMQRAEDQLKDQLSQSETMLASLHRTAAAAEAQAQSLAGSATAALNDLQGAASAATRDLAAPIAALTEALEASFTRSTAATDLVRDAVHVQTNALLASVEQARVTIAHIGGEAGQALTGQLTALEAATRSLGGTLDGELGRVQGFADAAMKSFQVLDARLASAAATTDDTMAGITARLDEARTGMDALAERLAGAEALLAGLAEQLAGVAPASDAAMAHLAATLPEQAAPLAAMASQLAQLRSDAEALAAPLTDGGNAMASAQDRLDMARQALAAAQTELQEALATAQDLVQDMETRTGNMALMASGELINAFGQVRDVAQQTAGTMREALAGVVAEAEEALARAGRDTTEAAFAAPIRAHLDELGEAQARATAAGQAVADRMAGRLLALRQTVAEVESHVDAVETRAKVRMRNSLGRRADGLIRSLETSAVDLASLLAFDLDDRTWTDYAAGDGSAIARRLAGGLSSGVGREFQRHYSHDEAFRSEALRFMADFEALVADVVPERQGEALGAVMLGSTLGKLYLALAKAAGRLD